MKWLIWSNEHGAYWGPNQNGYTQRQEAAGRYEFQDAVEIVQAANATLHTSPDETMCPDWTPKGGES